MKFGSRWVQKIEGSAYATPPKTWMGDDGVRVRMGVVCESAVSADKLS